MASLLQQFKNPQGPDPQQLYKWAQDLIATLRKGLTLSGNTDISGQIGNANLANMAPSTIKGQLTTGDGGSTAPPVDLTALQANDVLTSFLGQGRQIYVTGTGITATAADSGRMIINFNANRTLNLPNAANGLTYAIYTLDGGSGGNLTVNVGSGSMNFADGSTAASTTLTTNQRMIITSDGSNWVVFAANFRNPPVPLPTVQRFLSGSGTYTPTAGFTKIRVRMAAGGGGGAAQNTNNGANGSDTSFGAWTAIHGVGGLTGNGGLPGTGGTGGVNGTGNLVARFPGANGQGGGNSANAGTQFGGGQGGCNPFGGPGAGGSGNRPGTNGATNTGAGGGGGGGNSSTASACGGGAGEYVEFWMSAAQVGASQAFSVGPGGNGGAAGGQAGGNGAAGIIIVEEFYD